MFFPLWLLCYAKYSVLLVTVFPSKFLESKNSEFLFGFVRLSGPVLILNTVRCRHQQKAGRKLLRWTAIINLRTTLGKYFLFIDKLYVGAINLILQIKKLRLGEEKLSPGHKIPTGNGRIQTQSSDDSKPGALSATLSQ